MFALFAWSCAEAGQTVSNERRAGLCRLDGLIEYRAGNDFLLVHIGLQLAQAVGLSVVQNRLAITLEVNPLMGATDVNNHLPRHGASPKVLARRVTSSDWTCGSRSSFRRPSRMTP